MLEHKSGWNMNDTIYLCSEALFRILEETKNHICVRFESTRSHRELLKGFEKKVRPKYRQQ